ncbi:MAG: metallophosphoesterase [Candidatus Aminicenantes bacterium]|nr:metallophosphoesterase [Candidatus Aminicenantes bacterium]
MKKLLIILFAAGICFAGENTTGFRVEPYLLDVTEHSATVAFFLHEPLPACVRVYHETQIRESCSPGKSVSHFIEITGLQPGFSYRYEVTCGRAGKTVRTPPGDNSFQIKTASRPGEYFTFAVFGDPRPGDTLTNRNHEEVINQALVQEPAFNLVLGDMVDDGADHKLWEDFFRIEAPLLRRSAIYPVIGDNDYAAGSGKYKDYFPLLEKGYYRFDWGDAVFFGLFAWDTRGSQPSSQFDAESPQYRWFQEEISKPEVQKTPFRVVFIHDPVYICRGRTSEVLRHTWAPLFEKHRVDVVFAGWHLYERSISSGVTYIISGGAGAELLWMNRNPSFPSQVDARQHHFCRVDVGAGAMNIRAIATDGTVLDSITLTPRGQDEDSEKQVENKARRLRKEIFLEGAVPGVPEIPLYLFSYDCSYCRRLLRNELPRLAREHNVALRVFYFDLSKEGAYDLFLNAGADFGRQDSDLPAIFMGRTVMGGEKEIETTLPGQIREFLAGTQQYRDRTIGPFTRGHDTRTMGENTFDALTAGIVLAAGLLDGINPCAFTTIIFLLSYLSLLGVSRRRMLYTGGIFTLAVFLTYFVIGLLFFNFARVILRQQGIATVVNVLLLFFVMALAALSFSDFIKCLKGRAADMTLQLPGFLKKGIHEKIRNFARGSALLAGATFVLGVVIAGMELTCTGQVYIPIVTMISEPQHRVMAISYLFLYNIAFIMPLVAVFLLAAFGLTSEKLAEVFKRHVAGVKLGFTVLFVLMALLIVYNLRWL